MAATASDRPRLTLEDALGALADANEHTRCAALKLESRSRLTLDDADVIQELNAARVALRRLREHLTMYHPQGLRGE